MQVGSDEGAAKYLAELDDDKVIGEWVDTLAFSPAAAEGEGAGDWWTKLLVGAVVPGLD